MRPLVAALAGAAFFGTCVNCDQHTPQPSSSVEIQPSGLSIPVNGEPDVHEDPEVFEQLVSLMAKMNSTDLMKMGQIFFMNKVSEILMPEEIHEDMGFHSSYWDEEQYTVHPVALSMLSTGPVVPLATFEPLFRSRLTEFGAVVVPSVLSREYCQELDDAIDQEIKEYPTYSWGHIMEREFRLDYPLPLTPLYAEALVTATKVVYGGLAPILGDDAILVEFAALYSYPQTKRQTRHPDLAMDSPDDISTKNRVVTVFVYLDDIGRDQAALDVWPGTHSHFHFLHNSERAMMASVPAVRMAVPAGTFVAYDARTLHRGTENTSPRRRCAAQCNCCGYDMLIDWRAHFCGMFLLVFGPL